MENTPRRPSSTMSVCFLSSNILKEATVRVIARELNIFYFFVMSQHCLPLPGFLLLSTDIYNHCVYFSQSSEFLKQYLCCSWKDFSCVFTWKYSVFQLQLVFPCWAFRSLSCGCTCWETSSHSILSLRGHFTVCYCCTTNIYSTQFDTSYLLIPDGYLSNFAHLIGFFFPRYQ